MNIVAIDPSLSCTAMVVNDKKFAFVNENIVYTKRRNFNKWFELTSPLASFNLINYNDFQDYSENEVSKLEVYNHTVNAIYDTIVMNVNTNDEIQVVIEGYSYSSAAGPLIDLVTFGTLLRRKLLQDLTNYVEIISPTSLKLEAAKLTYPPITKGKKVIKYEYRNNQGVAGGKFTKTEMYKALIENDNLQNDWVKFLRIHADEILSYKNIPKPIEDLNDAQLLYFVTSNR